MHYIIGKRLTPITNLYKVKSLWFQLKGLLMMLTSKFQYNPIFEAFDVWWKYDFAKILLQFGIGYVMFACTILLMKFPVIWPNFEVN